ncbi:MAG: protein-L-isoaspartate O-methyltransferase [Alphaproteobacteria bacterium]|nr:protein-L-isoaspartate O-methyltransferase [Alphaproteobacteria bacterium]
MQVSESAARRRHMIDSQLKPNKVTDRRVIEAMSAVPREPFLPRDLTGVAYLDEDLPIAPGRFLMEPMVFARLLQAAEIQPSDVVLDIGCGSGYSAAVLCRLAGTVVALESDKALAARAQNLLSELACDTVALVEGELSQGYPSQAPYNVIILEGSVAAVPEAISNELAEGGRLVAVLRDRVAGTGRATLFTRRAGVLGRRVLFDAATPELPGFRAPAGFVF